MPIPQVTDRLKEVPAVVLRTAFAGIGQLLLAADRIRSRALGQVSPGEPSSAGQPGQVPVPGREPTGETGDVTVLHEDAAPAGPAERAAADGAAQANGGAPAGKPSAARSQPAARPAPAARSRATRPVSEKPASPAGKRAGTVAPPPIPGYDDLSFASLRARLRVLDADALRSLLNYERAHAHRDAVITMFERRLAKISEEAG